MTEWIHALVYWCEEHQASITTPCCDEAKEIGWFDTYGIKK